MTRVRKRYVPTEYAVVHMPGESPPFHVKTFVPTGALRVLWAESQEHAVEIAGILNEIWRSRAKAS